MEYEVLLLIGIKGISIMTVGALYEHYDCIFGACEEKDCSYSYPPAGKTSLLNKSIPRLIPLTTLRVPLTPNN
jgi:hypothetical protein